MELVRVRLQAAEAVLPELTDFYAAHLGVQPVGDARFTIGESELEFVPAPGAPFYHFALLVPGDRFEAALESAQQHITLLSDPETNGVVFDFSNWNALACYFEDPAGNIVELIAHRDVARNGEQGKFAAQELVGLSELGLVGDTCALERGLAHLDLRLWDGTVDEPGRLAFVGERARTLILCPPGRGWLPTGRPAEPHAVHMVLSGFPAGEVGIGAHRIAREPAVPEFSSA